MNKIYLLHSVLMLCSICCSNIQTNIYNTDLKKQKTTIVPADKKQEQLDRTEEVPESWRKEQEDNIREILVRNQINSGMDHVKFYYIRFGSNKKAEDPSDEFMQRLKDYTEYTIKKTSECVTEDKHDWAVRDKITNEFGAILTVRKIKWINKNTVEGTIQSWRGTLSGFYLTFRMEFKDGKWYSVKCVEVKVS